ncbi:MAG TPA: hypothetical protein VGI85_12605 [Chthoniobacterales bacterium]
MIADGTGKDVAQLAPDPILGVDKDNALHFVTDCAQSWDQSHPLGDFPADPPEIDHVTAGAKLRRTLDEDGGEGALEQPPGEDRSGDADTRDEDR